MANQWNSSIYWNSAFTWGGGALVDFTWEPNYVFNESIGFVTNIKLMDSGKEFRYSKGQPRREFALDFMNRDEDTATEIRDFFIVKEGTNQTFYWQNPNDDDIYEVRFKEDSLDIEYIDYDIYNVRLTLREVI